MNFDAIYDRRNTPSLKWGSEQLLRLYGTDDVIPLWTADMDFKAPPAVIESLSKCVHHGILGYGIRRESYYDAVIGWMKRCHGWNIKKEWIYYTPGVIPAVNYAIQALCLPGDKIIIQSPVYYPFYASITNNGCQILDNSLSCENGRYFIDFGDLEEKAKDPRTKLILLCSPHNPVSRIWNREELQKIGDICLKNDVIVISDEIHNDLALGDEKHTVFASISEEFAQNTITCTAPSKTFNMAGMYTSNIIISNRNIANRFQAVLDNCCVGWQNILSIHATEAAYRQGGEWLDELKDYLRQNVALIEKYFGKSNPMTHLIDVEATYLAWIDMSAYKIGNAEQFFADKARVGVYDGAKFGKCGEGFVRLCFACPSSVLEEALKRMSAAVGQLG